ncbi:hypothetical protein TSOC_008964, partial [Tetrabaena socialis]
MLRGLSASARPHFATRIAMDRDPETGLLARGSRGQSGLDAGDLGQDARGSSSFGQGVLVFFLVLLALGVLPAPMIVG